MATKATPAAPAPAPAPALPAASSAALPEAVLAALQAGAAQALPDRMLAPADAHLARVVAAAGLDSLAPGPGVLLQETKDGLYRREVSCLSVLGLRVGDEVGHHVKVFRKVEGAGGGAASWQQLSTSCHDCQHQHIKWRCPDPRHTRAASYCNRCLHYRYRPTSFSVADLHASCPLCRGACTCKACLRQPEHAGRVVPPQPSAEEYRRCGAYLGHMVGPHLAHWLAQQQEELCAGGFSGPSQLPLSLLVDRDRVNCDRCGTNLVGVSAHCPACCWDLCGSCMRELRLHSQQQQQQQQQGEEEEGQQQGLGQQDGAVPLPDARSSITGGSSGSSSAFVWTCCSPTCPGAAAAAAAGEPAGGGKRRRLQSSSAGGSGSSSGGGAGRSTPAAAVTGADLWCLPGGQQLTLQLLLPQDLLCAPDEQQQQQQQQQQRGGGSVGEDGADEPQPAPAAQLSESTATDAVAALYERLERVAQAAAEAASEPQAGGSDSDQQPPAASTSPSPPPQQQQHQLRIEDCPLLPPDSPLPLLGPDGVTPLTLQQLEGPQWWLLLPPHLRDPWRRKAGGPGSSTQWLFTPHVADLEGGAPPGSSSSSSSSNSAPAAAAAAAMAAGAAPDDADAAEGQQQQQQEQPQQAQPPRGNTAVRVALARVLFWARWRRGEPIIVRGLKGRIPWDPDTMRRAIKEVQAELEQRVAVIDCADMHVADDLGAHTFFRGYREGVWRLPGSRISHNHSYVGLSPAAASADGTDAGCLMLKVKDWPPTKDFGAELPRHLMDFLERLPLRRLTDPRLGRAPLNLAAALVPEDNPTDLGPKCYLAYGRWPEAGGEGDSVTKLHLDMTDAVNILVDCQPGGDAQDRRERARLLQPQEAQEAAGGEGTGQVREEGGQPEEQAQQEQDAKQQQQQLEQPQQQDEQVAGQRQQSQDKVDGEPSDSPGSEAGGAAGTANVIAAVAAARCGDADADKPGYGGAGAVWDIYARGPEAATLSAWLGAHAHEFTHMGSPLAAAPPTQKGQQQAQQAAADGAAAATDGVVGSGAGRGSSGGGDNSGGDNSGGTSGAGLGSVMSQCFMLTERHRQQLRADTGIAGWHFEQHYAEGVFIPGGCPHQVRNLMSCCKVAVDFVSPEGLAACLGQREALRQLDLGQPRSRKDGPVTERDHAEKLQSHLVLLRGALAAEGMTAHPQRITPPSLPELPEHMSKHKRRKQLQQQQQGSQAKQLQRGDSASGRKRRVAGDNNSE